MGEIYSKMTTNPILKVYIERDAESWYQNWSHEGPDIFKVSGHYIYGFGGIL